MDIQSFTVWCSCQARYFPKKNRRLQLFLSYPIDIGLVVWYNTCCQKPPLLGGDEGDTSGAWCPPKEGERVCPLLGSGGNERPRGASDGGHCCGRHTGRLRAARCASPVASQPSRARGQDYSTLRALMGYTLSIEKNT